MQRCVFCFSLLMRSEHSARVGKTVQKKPKLMIIAPNTETGFRCGPLICQPHHWKHCIYEQGRVRPRTISKQNEPYF